MKKAIKLAVLFSSVAAMAVAATAPSCVVKAAGKTGWEVVNGAWAYYEDNTIKKGWHYDSASEYWYYLDHFTGEMKTGWMKDGDTWYFFERTGDADIPYGAMRTGLSQIDGKTYFFNKDGKMATGYKVVGTKVYYFDESDGSLVNDPAGTWEHCEDWKWRYKDKNGEYMTGWVYDAGTKEWYHMAADGAMDIGWLSDNGKEYWLEVGNLDSTEPLGSMATGVTVVDNEKKMFSEDSNTIGENLTRIWFTDQNGKKHYADENGNLVKDKWMFDGDNLIYLDINGDASISIDKSYTKSSAVYSENSRRSSSQKNNSVLGGSGNGSERSSQNSQTITSVGKSSEATKKDTSHTHDYTKIVSWIHSACTERATTTYYCDCGYSYTEYGDYGSHSPLYGTNKCKYCGEEYNH